MATSAMPVVHALPRAVSPCVLPPQMLLGNQKIFPARQALLLNCDFPDSACKDEELVDEALVAGTADVASLTGRNEVLGRVVGLVFVDMINHKTSGPCAASWGPGHRTATPVAGMRSLADLLPQDEAMFREPSISASQRMVLPLHVSVRADGHCPRVHEVM